jgi:hypothetical protein
MARPSRKQPGAPEISLPHRFAPRSYQLRVWRALEQGCRRAVTVWHRRSGKDITALNWMITRMVQRPGLYLHLFPDGVQARRAIWDGQTINGIPFLEFFPPDIVLERNETEMSIRTVSQGGGMSIYQLAGTDKADRLRGLNPLGIIFSEYATQSPAGWEIVAPALVANGGWAWFCFTPNGRNHGFDLHRQAMGDPAWFAEQLTIEQTTKDATDEDGGPVVAPHDLEAERHRGVDEDFIQQEYFCSFEGTRSGSYFGEALRRAREQGRITKVPWDPTQPVETWVDLGVGEHLAVWAVQYSGPRVHVLRFWQGRGSDSIEVLAKVLCEWPYSYSYHYWPHDAKQTEQSNGRTRKDIAERLGIRSIEVVDKLDIEDGITAARALIERCYFDEENCRRGLDCLAAYHRERDPKGETWREAPKHDWSSHAADAFRTGAVGTRGGMPLTPQRIEVISEFSIGGRSSFYR